MPIYYVKPLCISCKKEGFPDCNICEALEDIPITKWAASVYRKLGIKSKHIRPRIEWCWRRTSTAGTAWSLQQLIRLSARILYKEPDKMIYKTLAHEICHLVSTERGHGPQWKSLMVKLGLPPKRCHQYKTPSHDRRVSYFCSNCGRKDLSLGPIQHKKVVKQGYIYTHRNCGGYYIPLDKPKLQEQIEKQHKEYMIQKTIEEEQRRRNTPTNFLEVFRLD